MSPAPGLPVTFEYPSPLWLYAMIGALLAARLVVNGTARTAFYKADADLRRQGRRLSSWVPYVALLITAAVWPVYLLIVAIIARREP